ncbi:MAG TPA: hypothetical protein VMV53_00195 [Acidimicrobiales bacterium]|nr:hypothetical protein [Acidimicrobiales bacterium]
MIATNVAYDLVLLVHIIVAVATVTVLIAMRAAARQIVRGADAQTQAARFPLRRNWAARLMHLLPVTGLIMSLSGTSDVSLTRPWIGVGILCYLAAAGHLEARTLPLERVVSEVVHHDGVASPDRGRQLVRSIDTLVLLIAVALVAMLMQF